MMIRETAVEESGQEIAPRAASSPETWLGTFLNGRKEHTLQAYRQDLTDFQHFLKATSPEEAVEMLFHLGAREANALALGYRGWLTERALSSSTINRRLATLRSLARFGHQTEAITWELEVPGVRLARRRDSKSSSASGFQALLGVVQGSRVPHALRDCLMLHLLHDLGLRCGEVAQLCMEHVDMERGTLMVPGARLGSEPLPIPPTMRQPLESWLEWRGTADGPLLCNFDRARKAGGLTPTSIYRIVRSLGEEVGLRVRPHALRRSAFVAPTRVSRRRNSTPFEVMPVARS